MSGAAIIRPVEESDADTLAKVHVTCWQETYRHLLSDEALARLHPDRMAGMWRRAANQDGERRSIAALVDGDLVGFAGRGPCRDGDNPSPTELYFIYVLRDHHGTGIGQQLLDAALDPGPAHLWVAAENPRARRFYTHNGFALDGSEKEEAVLGEPLLQVRMVR